MENTKIDVQHEKIAKKGARIMDCSAPKWEWKDINYMCIATGA